MGACVGWLRRAQQCSSCLCHACRSLHRLLPSSWLRYHKRPTFHFDNAAMEHYLESPTSLKCTCILTESLSTQQHHTLSGPTLNNEGREVLTRCCSRPRIDHSNLEEKVLCSTFSSENIFAEGDLQRFGSRSDVLNDVSSVIGRTIGEN